MITQKLQRRYVTEGGVNESETGLPNQDSLPKTKGTAKRLSGFRNSAVKIAIFGTVIAGTLGFNQKAAFSQVSADAIPPIEQNAADSASTTEDNTKQTPLKSTGDVPPKSNTGSTIVQPTANGSTAESLRDTIKVDQRQNQGNITNTFGNRPQMTGTNASDVSGFRAAVEVVTTPNGQLEGRAGITYTHVTGERQRMKDANELALKEMETKLAIARLQVQGGNFQEALRIVATMSNDKDKAAGIKMILDMSTQSNK